MNDKKKFKKFTLLITNIILWGITFYILAFTQQPLIVRLNYSLKSAPTFDINNNSSYKTLVDNFKEITLIGESHGIEKTYTFLDNLIKTTNEENKLNYIVIEASPAEAAIINLYLTSGDRNHLLNFISNNIGTSLASQEFINIINTVKKTNEDREIPIRFVGVDLENSEQMLLYYLKHVLEPFAENLNVKELCVKISTLTTITSKDSKELLNLIGKNEHILPLRTDDIFDIKMALTQRYSEKELTSPEILTLRDKNMEECFIAYKEYLPKGYFLVNMGSSHISNNSYTVEGKKVESFGSLLNKEESTKNQLYTIDLEYLNSKSMFNENLGTSHSVSTLPYITFIKLQDKIVYPNTKAFNRIEDWKKFESGESTYHMPNVVIIFLDSDSVNSTNLELFA